MVILNSVKKVHLLHELASELVFRTKNQWCRLLLGVLLRVSLEKMLFLRSLFHLCIKKYIFLFSGYIIREDEVRRERQIMHTTFRAESG